MPGCCVFCRISVRRSGYPEQPTDSAFQSAPRRSAWRSRQGDSFLNRSSLVIAVAGFASSLDASPVLHTCFAYRYHGALNGFAVAQQRLLDTVQVSSVLRNASARSVGSAVPVSVDHQHAEQVVPIEQIACRRHRDLPASPPPGPVHRHGS